MQSSVILKKVYAKNDFGTLFIRYYNGKGIKKDRSLKIKINESIFKDTFGKAYQRFKKTTRIDYIHFNNQIALYIDDFSLFDEIKNTENTEILPYLKSKLKLIGNPATRHSYSCVIALFEQFLVNYEIKEFKDLTMDLFLEFRNYLREKGTKESSMIQYFVVLKTMLNKASKNIEFKNPLIIKELGLKAINKRKNILSKIDILKLINTNNQYKYFTEVQISLFQLFCNGARISDVFLMKFENLKKDGVLYVTKKTNTELFVHYNPPLVDILFNYFNLHSKLGFNITWEDNNWIYPDNSDMKFGKMETKLFILLEYLETCDKNKLIFHDYISKKGSILLKYDKEKEMTDEQMRVFNNILGYHLQKLKFIIKSKKLEIENLTTHTMRYTFTNLLLTMDGVNLLDISKALGHANIRVTNDYLDRNYGSDRRKDISMKLGNLI